MHTFAVDFQRWQNMKYSEEEYENMLSRLFARFPSFQNAGASAYKPGLANMQMFDQLLGCPHRKYPTVHVAGTNGKGSVSNMLASVFSSLGLRTALYTSPHLYDFRERMRIASADGVRYVPKEFVWDFVQKWGETFDHLDLSFFEITTAMAFAWFASEDVDVAVIETGLGGRLDSTNIITPQLSVITNIGLDHCSFLGDTLGEIAFEKAGIIKPEIPVVVGESSPETDVVFERKVLYTNLPEAAYMGDRAKIMSLLTFADKIEPGLWDRHGEILGRMDLQGPCQRKNLRTVLAAIDILSAEGFFLRTGIAPGTATGNLARPSGEKIAAAIEHTARTMDFHGRWEKLSDNPLIIADIGHNSHGLKHNFQRLSEMMSSGEYDSLTIVYAAMGDKDVDKIMTMLPPQSRLIFVTPSSHRAMKAEDIFSKYLQAGNDPSSACCSTSVEDAVRQVVSLGPRDLVYIGGSTYLVAEAVPLVGKLQM